MGRNIRTMNNEFPFTKEYLRTLPRDKLVKLAQYSGIKVKRNNTEETIIKKLWDRYYPPVLICDSSLYPVHCEQHMNAEGELIIVYDGQEYNLSRMSERLKRILDTRIREGLQNG